MPFVKLTRVLPDGNSVVAVNTDMIVWVEQTDGKVIIMPGTGMEIEVVESFQAVLTILGMDE